MNLVKNIIVYLIQGTLAVLEINKIGRFIKRTLFEQMRSNNKKILHNTIHMLFATPNELCNYRATTFSTKEPETLEWIDNFTDGSVLWDIGANVGLYSIYAARRHGCHVFSFEPSVFNLECLARNCFLNAVTDLVTLMPFALNDQTCTSTLNMSSTDLGGALSTFDKSYGHDGRKLFEVFRFKTLGISIDDVVKYLGIPNPDYIKLDVDGIEHMILRGGTKALLDTKGILIEVNEDFNELSIDCKMLLHAAGFELREKRQGIGTNHGVFKNTFNQIWQKVQLEQ